jgi:ADP-heptose:LPS heptosyltransferase
MPPKELIPGVRRVAVLRANALGDFVFGLPALEALRAAYPAAEILLLCAKWIADFVNARPGPVTRAVAVPIIRGVGAPPDAPEDPAELERFIAGVAAGGIDLALQLHGGGRHSNPIVRRLGARVSVGLRAADAPPLDRSLPYDYYQREVLRLLEVVALAGARPVTVEPRLAVTPADLAEAAAVAPADERPLVVIHPAVGDERRRWPAARFAEVGRALAAQGVRVALTGTPQDTAICAEVAEHIGPGAAENLCARLSLGGLAGLLGRSRLIVSNDTGPLHVGAAVGAATVGVYWCGNVINAGPMTQARNRVAISWRLRCPVCGVDCTSGQCEHRDSFVADVPTAEVLGHALELLERGSRN